MTKSTDETPAAISHDEALQRLKREIYKTAILHAKHKLMELAREAQLDNDNGAADTLQYAADIVGQLSYKVLTVEKVRGDIQAALRKAEERQQIRAHATAEHALLLAIAALDALASNPHVYPSDVIADRAASCRRALRLTPNGRRLLIGGG